MINTKTLKQQALVALKGKWVLAVGTTLLLYIINGVIFSIFNTIWGVKETQESLIVEISVMIIMGPLILGVYYLILNAVRKKTIRIGHIFRWFQDLNKFVEAFLIYLLVKIYIWLWTLLFIIPGIIKSFSYSMTYFIINDHPEYSMNQAITESRRMMDGHKIEYFLLCLSFIGWFLLSVITLGVGFLWLAPYFYTTKAEFYKDLSDDYYKRDAINREIIN
ncbi:DUF975 family protein [Bacillus sp. FSL K6-0067]|uniref:DUF975 family protein n=1 Tax=Bacillus sp. FSL K6-0067 TaxID=2921412 RepID=UPI00077AB057|nr:DUF975 family protein [Bacillus cereus]KXY18295.1 hypothetical protein AT267_08580 [Bacillus cereus]